MPPHAERALDPAECASCHPAGAQPLVIDCRRRVPQRLLEVFGFEKRVLGEQRGVVRIRREQFEDAANGDPHPPDARLPNAFSRLNRNPIEQVYRRHMLSLDHRAPSRWWQVDFGDAAGAGSLARGWREPGRAASRNIDTIV